MSGDLARAKRRIEVLRKQIGENNYILCRPVAFLIRRQKVPRVETTLKDYKQPWVQAVRGVCRD